MNTDIIAKEGFAYLVDFQFHILSEQEVKDINEGYFFYDIRPIPIDKEILLYFSFHQCLDNFGKGFYFKGLGINLWYNQDNNFYFYRHKNRRYNMKYISDLQEFLDVYVGLKPLNLSIISDYINKLYANERRLFTMSPKMRHNELDNWVIRKIDLKTKKQTIFGHF